MSLTFSLQPTSSSSCRRCEVLPPKLQGPGTLHLQFPLSHSRAKLLTFLNESSLEYSQDGDLLRIEADDADLLPIVSPLLGVLSPTEQADVRVLFQPRGRDLQLGDAFETDSLRGFCARAQSHWLLEMMSENRLTSWFQPIVSCQNPDEVFAFEALLRGQENGNLVFPGRILEVARGAGLLFQLDRAARLSSIAQAAHWNMKCHVFINFTPTSIYDPVNCLSSTVRAVDELGLCREQVVFEVIESENVGDVEHLKTILDYYRASGFRVALDDVGSGYSSLKMLGQLRPDFIKLDRELTTDVHRDDFKALIARKLLETAQGLGLKTVAEGVETGEEFEWLQEVGADYVQGYYFAKPASPPPLLEQQMILF
jgi:EAL domain-containing protein (putative c-di-GMP-specific phosphodiesterase class I)